MSAPSGPWTRHGHDIPGVTVAGSQSPAIARCGGPALCRLCREDVAQARGEKPAAPARPTADQLDDALASADIAVGPSMPALAAEVRALRAELASSEFALKGWLDAAGAQSEEIERLGKELRKARTPQPAGPVTYVCDQSRHAVVPCSRCQLVTPAPLPAVPDGEDDRRQAVLDRQREELGWGRWLSRAAEKVRRAQSGPGETAAVAELIRVLDTPRPSAEGASWSARDDGGCIRCDSPGPHVPLTSCGECGVTWLRADVPAGASDGEDVPARLDAAAEASPAVGDLVEYVEDGGVLGKVTAVCGGTVTVEFPNGVATGAPSEFAVVRAASRPTGAGR